MDIGEKAVILTDNAQMHVEELVKKQNIGNYLRVFVKGGGCSGLQYGISLAEKANEDDEIIDYKERGFSVLLDPMSAQYLNGVRIDYGKTEMGEGFRMENPNAVSSCGCGHSFRA